MEKQYGVPVAVIVFNRVALAERILRCLEQIKPEKLFIISDGPRERLIGEEEKVAQVRALFQKVSWPCEIYRNYSEKNMGCDFRVPTGVDWVFEHVEQAIILEDDCIPSLDFFQYAEDMLKKYQEDPRIMMVSGSNLAIGYEIKNSCCFTARVYTWGWATWRRAWRYYCDGRSEWDRIQKDGTLAKIYSLRTRYYVKRELNYYFDKGKCPWDYLWWISCMGRGGLCTVPKVNLITNEGFGENATHTQNRGGYTGESYPMDFPLVFPEKVERDKMFDRYDSDLNPPWIIVRAYRKIFRCVKKFIKLQTEENNTI